MSVRDLIPGMAEQIRINNHGIGPGQPCYVIAEAGVNHNGSLQTAKELVLAAREVGAPDGHDQQVQSAIRHQDPSDHAPPGYCQRVIGRHHIKDGTGRTAYHPIEVLYDALETVDPQVWGGS